MSDHVIYLIVDNRPPAEVPHWPAFAAWWASRRCLVGPQEETTEVLWVCAGATTGLHKIPYCWAGVFVEAARFLYPAQHFALIDNDCVPVTLFEVQDPLQLAHQQHQWVDLIGCARPVSRSCSGIGMLLFAEAHLEYNAGLVISVGNRHKSSPMEHETSAAALAKSLQACRLTLVSRAKLPIDPSDAAINGTMFTPFVGVQCKLGRPTLATLESTAFLALGFGAVNGQDFPTRRDPLGRFTLFLISQLVSGSRVSLTQGRAGPAGVETAEREHGSCNHAVGE